jgi:hypothetical protein
MRLQVDQRSHERCHERRNFATAALASRVWIEMKLTEDDLLPAAEDAAD